MRQSGGGASSYLLAAPPILCRLNLPKRHKRRATHPSMNSSSEAYARRNPTQVHQPAASSIIVHYCQVTMRVSSLVEFKYGWVRI